MLILISIFINSQWQSYRFIDLHVYMLKSVYFPGIYMTCEVDKKK